MNRRDKLRKEITTSLNVLRPVLVDARLVTSAKRKKIEQRSFAAFRREAREAKDSLLALLQEIVDAEARLVVIRADGDAIPSATVLRFKKKPKRAMTESRWWP